MPDITKKRVVLTSVNQILALAKSNDALLGLPRFGPLRNMTNSVTPKKGCNCGAKTNFLVSDENKQVMESILSSLTKQDFLDVKHVLGLDELCYYVRGATNKLELVCT